MERPALVAKSSVRTVAPAPVSQTSDPITEDRVVRLCTRKLMLPSCQPSRLALLATVDMVAVVCLVWLVPWHRREVSRKMVDAKVAVVPPSP